MRFCGRRRWHSRRPGRRFREAGRNWSNPGRNPFQGLYRSRDGMLLGVCRGIADHFDLSVVWVRLLVLVLFVMGGFWPMGVVYVFMALILKPEPVIHPQDEDEERFYDGYVHSRSDAVHTLSSRYSDLERRLQRMEDVVTSSDYDWERRMNG